MRKRAILKVAASKVPIERSEEYKFIHKHLQNMDVSPRSILQEIVFHAFETTSI